MASIGKEEKEFEVTPIKREAPVIPATPAPAPAEPAPAEPSREPVPA